ncbi:MAG TPA: type III PLP-dependent enzyme [bacterium]
MYSREAMVARRNSLREALPGDVRILYAVKANPHPELLSLMGELYDGFDVSSLGEIRKALDAGVSAARLSFAGPGKLREELDFAVGAGVGSISVESRDEIEAVRDICRCQGRMANIMVRVNPIFSLAQSGMGMGGPRQFGIDADQVPPVLDDIRGDRHLNFQGIHVFSGSQNLSAAVLAEHFANIVRYALDICAEKGMPLAAVNAGGGFGIPYFAGDTDLDLGAVGTAIGATIAEEKARLGKTTITLELGRYLVGECGVYLCRVLYRKVSQGTVFLVLDGGMHHHLAASGNLGQGLRRRPMPVVTANDLDGAGEKVTLVGPLCTPLDTFGTVEIPRADVGDLVAVMNSGAYGLSASPVNFLSRRPPVEALV